MSDVCVNVYVCQYGFVRVSVWSMRTCVRARASVCVCVCVSHARVSVCVSVCVCGGGTRACCVSCVCMRTCNHSVR